jgi:hypothetical protein
MSNVLNFPAGFSTGAIQADAMASLNTILAARRAVADEDPEALERLWDRLPTANVLTTAGMPIDFDAPGEKLSSIRQYAVGFILAAAACVTLVLGAAARFAIERSPVPRPAVFALSVPAAPGSSREIAAVAAAAVADTQFRLTTEKIGGHAAGLFYIELSRASDALAATNALSEWQRTIPVLAERMSLTREGREDGEYQVRVGPMVKKDVDNTLAVARASVATRAALLEASEAPATGWMRGYEAVGRIHIN